MEHINASELCANLNTILNRVNEDHEPVMIMRGEGQSVVIMDGEDYDSIMETLYLTRNPANAERLREGMRQHQAGQWKEIDVAAYLD